MANRSESRQKFLNAIATLGKSEVSRPEVFSVAENLGIPVPQWFLKEMNIVLVVVYIVYHN